MPNSISNIKLPFLLLLGFLLATPVQANETLIYNVIASTDDAEEGDDGPGAIDIDSSDLEIANDHADEPDRNQTVGIRFEGVAIEPGTPILGAYIQFTVDEDDKNVDPFSVTIQAQADDNAATFTTTDYDISSRPVGAESVLWADAPSWTVEHQNGPDQRTPDLSAVVQEVVDRAGWQSGNSIAFILQGDGTRTAESWDGSDSTVGLPDLAPTLVLTVPSSEVYPVIASTDDAEEGDDGPGVIDIDSSDLEIVDDHEDDPTRRQTVGVRLANVTIPVGAEILSAYLQFGVDEGDKNNDPFNVTIWGEANGNPATFSLTDYDISSRSKTTASVNWADIPEWTIDEEGVAGGPNQQTPDLTAIVQELVDRPDWAEGNGIAFIIEGEGQRTAESFDGDAAFAPALHVTFVGEQTVSNANKIRLSWSADPATTMNIIWNQADEADTYVLYDEYDAVEGCVTDLAAYANQHMPDRKTPYREMNNYFVNLTSLTPDTDYRFIITDGSAKSDCGWFRTAPDAPQPLTFISGGDTKSGGDALTAGRWSNEMVAKLRPLFIFFTGDYLSGDGTSARDWQQWLDDWDLTQSEDGRMYPILTVHGNHEDGDFEILYNLFDSGNDDPSQTGNYAYRALSVGGDLIRIYGLNSQFYLNGMSDAHDKQLSWLESDLMANQAHTFKIAGYHKPIRPHTASKSENDHELPWAELFDEYGLDIAFESDSHMHKFTFPLIYSEDSDAIMDFKRDDASGVLYVGEGSWGASPRANNDDKAWTLDSDSMNQIKWNHVYPAEGTDPAKWEIRTVVTARYVNGELTNFVDAVEEVDEADLFAEPTGITLREAPYYGEVISLPFVAIAGDAPLAPINLVGTASSYTDIMLTWENVSAAEEVRSIDIERMTGTSGEWTMVANGLAGTTNTYAEANLESGTHYVYRVRANNVFGSSDWSSEVSVDTPVDERLKVELSEGLDSYTGNQMVVIASASPDSRFTGADFGGEFTIDLDTSDYGGTGSSMALIRFDGLIDSLNLPAGTTIDSADLRFYTTSSTNGPVELYQMLQDWDPATVSWNTLGGDGIDANDSEAKSDADDSQPNLNGSEFVHFDVTDSLVAWVENGDSNYGWAIINQSGDGWDTHTPDYEGDDYERLRPRLTVFYNSTNEAPVVDAGTDQSVTEGDMVTLSGTVTDPDGDTTTLLWAQTAGTSVSLQDATTDSASFTAPEVDAAGETLTFTLTAIDPDGESDTDEVSVMVADNGDTGGSDDDSNKSKDDDDGLFGAFNPWLLLTLLVMTTLVRLQRRG